MYCRSCGASNEDNAYKCVNCGQALQVAAGQPMQPVEKVDDYLVWSILATLLCCLIPGIVAIVYSAQVKGKLAQGDYAGAVQSANTAKTWVWVAAVLGIALWVIYIVVIVLAQTGLNHLAPRP